MAQASLTWTPASGNTSTGQQVQYRVKGDPTYTIFSTLGIAASTETVTGLLPNKIYEFRILNVCNVGGPTPSSIRENILLTCPIVTVAKDYSSITASFPDLGGDITSYEVFLQTSGGGSFDGTTIYAPFASTVTATFNANISPSTTYLVKVVPYAGQYSKSNCATTSVTTDATPACLAPTNVVATMS